ncbi:MAG: hypothetical protein ACKOOG_14615 [Actinomycetota bacterium]
MEIPGLDPHEPVLATAAASFRGSLATSLCGGSARTRAKRFDAWRKDAEAAGFPTAGTEMVLVLTPDRLVVCATSFWTERPTGTVGTIALEQVAQIGVHRRGPLHVLAVVLHPGALVEIETFRGGRLRRLARAIDDALRARGR